MCIDYPERIKKYFIRSTFSFVKSLLVFAETDNLDRSDTIETITTE